MAENLQKSNKKGVEPLAKIIQQKIFSWKDVEVSGELERLKMVIEATPDDELGIGSGKEKGGGMIIR